MALPSFCCFPAANHGLVLAKSLQPRYNCAWHHKPMTMIIRRDD